MQNVKDLLNQIVLIAKEAGKGILDIYNSGADLNIQTKCDSSPVTQADILAHDIITNQLSQLTPDIPILSEEDPDFLYEIRRTWNRYWLVDPLDGTKEFIFRSGQFTVNIALIENHVPILGVIFVPLKNESYYAAKGVGAFKEDSTSNVTQLNIPPWQPGLFSVVVTRRELHENLEALLASYGTLNLTYRGSSLKFCIVAEGKADFYLRKKPIHEWDTAAGHCIVEQAGGIVLDSNWEPLRYNTKPDLLNPPFIVIGDSQQLLPILKSIPIF